MLWNVHKTSRFLLSVTLAQLQTIVPSTACFVLFGLIINHTHKKNYACHITEKSERVIFLHRLLQSADAGDSSKNAK